MRSPRFPHRQPQLRKVFATSALRQTWRQKVRYALRDRYLPDPLAYMDYHTSLTTNVNRINSQVTSGSYRPSQPTRILMEKSKGLCRQIVLPQIDDALILQRLSDSFFSSIRGKTPSKFAYFEPDNFAFSQSGKRTEYGSFAAWLHFQTHLFELTGRKRYIVITDIANYYDYIGFDLLRNAIASDLQVPEVVLDLLIFSLDGLNWQPDFMPRRGAGLPQIDLDAPRVLAHSFLFDLDKYARKKVGDNYTRYMDDINFGVDTISEAKNIIRDVDIILHTRQVRLNSGKTYILPASDARKFFRVDDHKALDSIQADLEFRRATGNSIAPISRRVESEITIKYRASEFDSGHGEKIFKRYLTLARQVDANVHRKILADALLRRPGSRTSVLTYLAARPLDLKIASIIENFLRSTDLVDDLPFIVGPSALVEMRALSRNALKPIMSRIAESLLEHGRWGLYGAIWLSSKYESGPKLLDLLINYQRQWVSDPNTARLVGGMYPRLSGSPLFKQYQDLIYNSQNSSASKTYEFHDRLENMNQVASAIGPFVRAPNPTKGTGITHAKFLQLLSIFRNPNVSTTAKKDLIARHSAAWRDAYYRSLAISALPSAIRSYVY